jgi:hypothetical protein
MTINAVTHQGRTFTRKGKAYTHAVITVSNDATAPLVEWASSFELAQKNHQGHLGRAAKAAKLADGEYLGGVYSTSYYREFVDSTIVEVAHPDKAPAGNKPASRSANRTDDDAAEASRPPRTPKPPSAKPGRVTSGPAGRVWQPRRRGLTPDGTNPQRERLGLTGWGVFRCVDAPPVGQLRPAARRAARRTRRGRVRATGRSLAGLLLGLGAVRVGT